MKILVTVKRAVDYNVKVRVKGDKTGIELSNLKMAINPFDEIAIEEAVRLKESGKAKEVIVVSIGPDKAQEQLRTAMALGADRAILVKTDLPIDLGGVEPLGVAKVVAKIASKELSDLIIMGKQAIDDDSGQTGQMVAAILGWPQGTFASKLSFHNGLVSVTREIDGGLQTIDLKLPAVVTTDLRLNKPRFVKLPEIMKAKQKPLTIIEPSSLDIDLSPRMKVIKVDEPPIRKGGIKVSSVDDLINKLRNEARVI